VCGANKYFIFSDTIYKYVKKGVKNMEKSKKQALILSIVAVVTLIALVVGATYAYFKAQGGTAGSTEVKVTTYTTDMLTFTTGSAISLYADQSSFGQEKGSLSGETFAKATLVANNKTNEATDNYYVYFNIENNTFKYTLGEDKPELILTVTGPDGSEVTSLPGLTHKVVQDRENKSISGFDVTTTNGLITIANKKTITATTDAKEEQYTLKLTFVNYEGDQTANATSSLSAKVMIQKEKIVQTVANICKNGQSLSSCIVAMDGIDETLYHHDASLTNGAGDNSYRFAGASDQVNNYVCFGSTTTPCPAGNLYRIIGVFDNKIGENQTEQRVKLIKSTSVGDKEWDSNNKNTWSTSSLNTYLNNEFINTFDETTKGKIADTTWKVGGNPYDNIVKQPAKTAYQNEMVNTVATNSTDNKTESSAKIGLMYASDYGFAAAQSAWTTNLIDYDGEAIKSANWMFLGAKEWTISRNADNPSSAFYVYNAGYVYSDLVGGGAFGVRPVFNLTSSVNYASGSGTAADPISIN